MTRRQTFSIVRRLAFRFARLRRWHEHETLMDAEMQHHIELETRANIAAGMSSADARRAALRDFGGIERHKEDARDQRALRLFDDVMRDLEHTLRVLKRNPTYTIASVLTLALGVGCATTIYTVVHGVLVRALPYAQPDRLAVIWERNLARNINDNVVSPDLFEAMAGQAKSFSLLSALVPSPVTIGGSDHPERVMGADVSPGYFRLLGVKAAIGRGFAESDTLPGAADVVVLGDALWRRRFGADAGIVGRQILLDERKFTVIGVMPPDFDPPKFGWLGDHQFWTPWKVTAENRSWGRYLLVVGRLRDGVSLDAGRREVETIAARRTRTDTRLAGWSTNVVPLATQITGEARRPLLMLLIAVGLLLALAATNLGGLVLGFLRRRLPEHLLRRALGASAPRLFRELAIHGVVLGAIGVAIGLLFATLSTRAMTAILPPGLPRLSSVRLDASVLLAGVAVGMATAVLCGCIAAGRATAELGDAGHSIGARSTARASRGSIVVAEIALSVVLTLLAVLMVRSFANLRSVRLGFDSSHVVAARISLPGAAYGTPERQRAFFELFGRRLRALPGVTAAGFMTSRPFECCAPSTSATNPGEPSLDAGTVSIRYADSSTFVALRVATLAGGTFSDHERADGPVRVVINQRLANALYRGNAVGKSIRIALGDPLKNTPDIDATVIGVVSDVHLTSARESPTATAYLATTRFPSTVRDVVIRADAASEGVIASARRTLGEIDARLPLAMAAPLDDAVNASLARDRFIAFILAAFAAASALLAAIGIYGLFAADVAARRKEIGVRIALGASGWRVTAPLLSRALTLAVVGASIGVAFALAASRLMDSIVFGVATTDPLSFALVCVVLALVAMIATLIPAARAAGVPPLEAIRND